MDGNAIIELKKTIESLDHTLMMIIYLLIIFIIVLAVSVWYIARLIPDTKGVDSLLFDDNKAQELYDKGEIELLKQYLEKYFDRYPNDVTINWYFALVHYISGNYQEALSYFNRVKSINPNWGDAVVGYVKEIEQSSAEVRAELIQ